VVKKATITSKGDDCQEIARWAILRRSQTAEVAIHKVPQRRKVIINAFFNTHTIKYYLNSIYLDFENRQHNIS
jgi:hypothetical protein